MLDESGGSLDTEMPDMAAQPPALEGEDSRPMIDDGSPVFEALIDEDEDPNEGERQVEEPGLVTKESREKTITELGTCARAFS